MLWNSVFFFCLKGLFWHTVSNSTNLNKPIERKFSVTAWSQPDVDSSMQGRTIKVKVPSKWWLWNVFFWCGNPVVFRPTILLPLAASLHKNELSWSITRLLSPAEDFYRSCSHVLGLESERKQILFGVKHNHCKQLERRTTLKLQFQTGHWPF